MTQSTSNQTKSSQAKTTASTQKSYSAKKDEDSKGKIENENPKALMNETYSVLDGISSNNIRIIITDIRVDAIGKKADAHIPFDKIMEPV